MRFRGVSTLAATRRISLRGSQVADRYDFSLENTKICIHIMHRKCLRPSRTHMVMSSWDEQVVINWHRCCQIPSSTPRQLAGYTVRNLSCFIFCLDAEVALCYQGNVQAAHSAVLDRCQARLVQLATLCDSLSVGAWTPETHSSCITPWQARVAGSGATLRSQLDRSSAEIRWPPTFAGPVFRPDASHAVLAMPP